MTSVLCTIQNTYSSSSL